MATVSKSITSKFEKINADLRRRSTVSESIPSIFKKDQPCTNRSRRAFKKRAIQSFSRLIWSFDILITKKWPIRSKNQWSNSQTDQKIIRGRHRCLERQFPFALLERANFRKFSVVQKSMSQKKRRCTPMKFFEILAMLSCCLEPFQKSFLWQLPNILKGGVWWSRGQYPGSMDNPFESQPGASPQCVRGGRLQC